MWPFAGQTPDTSPSRSITRGEDSCSSLPPSCPPSPQCLSLVSSHQQRTMETGGHHSSVIPSIRVYCTPQGTVLSVHKARNTVGHGASSPHRRTPGPLSDVTLWEAAHLAQRLVRGPRLLSCRFFTFIEFAGPWETSRRVISRNQYLAPGATLCGIVLTTESVYQRAVPVIGCSRGSSRLGADPTHSGRASRGLVNWGLWALWGTAHLLSSGVSEHLQRNLIWE